MCGIVGYVGRERVSATALLECMELLQVDRQKWERTPVGGHGAGLAARTDGGELVTLKVGGDGNPVAALRDEIGRGAPWLMERGSDVLLGHVRRASPRFGASVPHREAAQPYVACCRGSLQVIAIHNGYVSNYTELLLQPHVLESADVGPVDSEILPHLLEELLDSGSDLARAVDALAHRIRGGNTASFLVRQRGSVHSALVHRGKTRGLTVWDNCQGELMFISRPGCLGPGLRTLLKRGGLAEVFRVGRRESARFARVWPVCGRSVVSVTGSGQ